MEDDDIKAYITALLQPTLQALDAAVNSLKSVEQRLHSELDSRLLVVDQTLAERHALYANTLGIADARFAALMAYETGEDVRQAWDRQREKFRQLHPAVFNPAMWQVEPDWLIALRQR